MPVNFFQDIGGIISTVVLTTIGTFFITRYTLQKSAANEAQIRLEELERHARYLAIRVVCKLDAFISDCCDVVVDSGMPDEDGLSRTRVTSPVLTLPENVDWKAISPELMYRVLGLPNDIEVARGLTDYLYQRDGGYCIAVVPSRWDDSGAKVCGAGGRYPSDEWGLRVL
mgnify:FL=1